MSKLNIVPAVVFHSFKDELGELFPKVCNDAKAFFGRLEKDIKVTAGVWKCSTKGELQSKDGNKVQMPLNNPMSILIRFGMQLNEIAERASFGGQFKLAEDGQSVVHGGIIASIPRECESWIAEQKKAAKVPAPVVPA